MLSVSRLYSVRVVWRLMNCSGRGLIGVLSRNFLGGLRKTTRNLSPDNLCPGRDLNREDPQIQVYRVTPGPAYSARLGLIILTISGEKCKLWSQPMYSHWPLSTQGNTEIGGEPAMPQLEPAIQMVRDRAASVIGGICDRDLCISMKQLSTGCGCTFYIDGTKSRLLHSRSAFCLSIYSLFSLLLIKNQKLVE
jgi:hypothetical protein